MLADNDLTKNTPLGGNIDVDKYRFCIQDAQMSRLTDVLGVDLYEKMRDDFPVFTGAYLDLYDNYLKWYLIHISAVQYILTSPYAVNNQGIFKFTPANGTPVEKAEVDYLGNNQRMKAEMWEDRLVRRLGNGDIPEYKPYNDCSGRSTNKHGGWFFK